METWQLWREMARESERATRLAEEADCPRSAASRYYYAAYQSATALLLYRGLMPPQDREAWSHDETPTLVSRETGRIIPSRDRRRDLSQRLIALFTLRVRADYHAAGSVTEAQINDAGRHTRFWLRIMDDVLPEEEQR